MSELNLLDEDTIIEPAYTEITTVKFAMESNFSDGYAPYFHNPEAFGSVLYKICQKIFGTNFISWDMDTLLISLYQRFGEIPEVNLDKIMSFSALANSFDGRLSFFNEVNCFRHTVNTLNGFASDYQFLGALMPQHINWAIYEVSQIFPGYLLDEEPAKFMGICYHKVGQLLLPDRLSKYQEFLDYYNKNIEAVPAIKRHWDEYKKEHKELNISSDIDKLNEDDVVHAQLLLLVADELYMDSKIKSYGHDIMLSNG